MERFFELEDYLPISFGTPKDQKYIAYLWKTFEENYSREMYQFAFLACHMLTMSFIYFSIWQIRKALPDDFAKSLIGFNPNLEKELLKATTPFSLSRVREKAVLRFLKLIDFDSNWIGIYGEIVNVRNNAAHANGHIYFTTQRQLDEKIETAIRVVEELQIHSRHTIQGCYEKFLRDSHDPEEREYRPDEDQVREVLIYGHYMSKKDIEICANFNVSEIQHHSKQAILDLHNSLHEFHRNMQEDIA